MCTVSYRWALPAVVRLCELDPLNVSFCFRADVPTRHYIALAIARVEEGARPPVDLIALAHGLARQPRRELLRTLCDRDFGGLGFLGRLPRRVMTRASYLDLVAIVGDPPRRRMLAGAPVITPSVLRALLGSRPEFALICKRKLLRDVTPSALAFAADNVARLRPDISTPDLNHSLARVTDRLTLAEWVEDLVSDATFPEPPWTGNALCHPITSAAALRAVARDYGNCLGNASLHKQVIAGRSYYYACNTDPPMIAKLHYEAVFRCWRVSTIRGRANAAPSAAILDKICVEFERAEIPWVNGHRFGWE